MNKIRAAGLGTHDVVFLGAGFEDIAIKQKLIDAARRRQDRRLLADVFPPLKKTKEDGNIYCATYSFGLNGLIAYDPAKTGGDDHVLEGCLFRQVQGPHRQDRQVERAGLAHGLQPRLQIRRR